MAGFINEVKITQVKVLHAGGQAAAVPTPQPVACCALCAQKAFFFASQVDAQGQVAKKSYCLQHAYQAGLMHPKAWDFFGVGSTIQPRAAEKKCVCGTSEEMLKMRGRAGCPACYGVFTHLFAPVVGQVQAGRVHMGKAPRRKPLRINVRQRVERLEQALRAAIQVERYEEAAQVRDQIAQLLKAGGWVSNKA